jgi:ATP-dependent DNA helicase RecQ
LTATATPPVQNDIRLQLGLREPLTLIGHPDRPNLIYRAFPRHDQSRQVLEVIKRYPGQGGIVYAQTRREVERLAQTLSKAGVLCAPYHAGLDPVNRAKTQDDFVHERIDVVVATIAFGMGIDRANVRYVVHANTPKSVEHYQQESGRAGRDGELAECVLLFSVADIITHRALALKDDAVSPERRRVLDRHLHEIGRYAIAPVCRHRLLSEYFGQVYPAPYQREHPSDHLPDNCRACDVCLGETQALPEDDARLIAQKIISAVFRTENRFGASYVVKVLLGRVDERIQANQHDQLKVFGLLQEQHESTLRAWIDQLIVQGFLSVTSGEYPLLAITPAGFCLCKGEGSVRLGQPAPRPTKSRRRALAISTPADLDATATDLFEQLRQFRLLLARALALPPYVIFADSVLATIAQTRPSSLDMLRQIKGIGDHKRDRYGAAVLRLIAGEAPPDVVAFLVNQPQ